MNRFCVLTTLSILSLQATAQIEATVSGRAIDADQVTLLARISHPPSAAAADPLAVGNCSVTG